MSVRPTLKLPTVAEVRARPLSIPKKAPVGKPKATPTEPTPSPDALEARCRAAVWKRDQGRSRASGAVVVKGHEQETQRGEVAHLEKRSTSPAKKWDPANCVLLTAEEHRLSDPRTAGGKVLLEIRGKNARKVLIFTRRNPDGTVAWTRQSLPPPLPKKETP